MAQKLFFTGRGSLWRAAQEENRWFGSDILQSYIAIEKSPCEEEQGKLLRISTK